MSTKRKNIITKIILVIEKNKKNIHTISELLQKLGHNIKFTSDTKEALEILVKNRPNVILIGTNKSKLNMLKFARILKNDEDTKNITIIALLDSNFYMDPNTYMDFDEIIHLSEKSTSFMLSLKKIIDKANNKKSNS